MPLLKKYQVKLIAIVLIIVSAICIMSILYKLNVREEIMASKRHYKVIYPYKELSLPVTSKYMAFTGENQNSYFFQTDDPAKLLVINHSLTHTNILKTGFSLTDTKGQAFIYKIHPPFLYLFIGNLSQVKRINLSNRSIQTFKTPSVFNKVLLIDTARFSLLGFSHKAPHNMVLQHGLIGRDKTASFEEQALPSTPSTQKYLFAMDGFLHFHGADSNIILTSFYQPRTHIIKYKSRFNETLPSIVHDTVTQTIKGTFKEGRYTNTSPKRTFQLYSGLIGDTLLIQSKVPAANDTYSFFRKHLILDRYHLGDKHYIGSYAIPKKKNLKAKVVPYAGGIFILYPTSIQRFKP